MNAKHHQHEEVGQASKRQGALRVEDRDDDEYQDRDTFKMAKQLSYDFSSEFKGCDPLQEGLVQDCRIGDPELVQFLDPGIEAIEQPLSNRGAEDPAGSAVTEDEDGEEDDSGDDSVSEGDDDEEDDEAAN